MVWRTRTTTPASGRSVSSSNPTRGSTPDQTDAERLLAGHRHGAARAGDERSVESDRLDAGVPIRPPADVTQQCEDLSDRSPRGLTVLKRPHVGLSSGPSGDQ